jgi:hypothetical protein
MNRVSSSGLLAAREKYTSILRGSGWSLNGEGGWRTVNLSTVITHTHSTILISVESTISSVHSSAPEGTRFCVRDFLLKQRFFTLPKWFTSGNGYLKILEWQTLLNSGTTSNSRLPWDQLLRFVSLLGLPGMCCSPYSLSKIHFKIVVW